ncbi:MAG TPA: hypothetical protein VIL36_18920 [Acidimicrobiales bacterium]
MKRTLVGAGLLVAAGIGSVAMAPTGSAQGGPQYNYLEASLEPNPAEPGAEVTFSSVDPCSGKEADDPKDETAAPGDVGIYQLDAEGNIVEVLPSVDMEDDYSWSTTLTAPSEPGTYYYGAECRNEIHEEELRKCVGRDHSQDAVQGGFKAANISYSAPAVPTWHVDCIFHVYVAELTVGGDEVPPTTTPEDTPPVDTPPPATPVVTPPDFTG